MAHNRKSKIAGIIERFVGRSSNKTTNRTRVSKTRACRIEQLERRQLFAGQIFDSEITTESNYPVGKSSSYAVASDNAGNTYMGGVFNGTADFDRNGTQPGNSDILTVEPIGSGGSNGFIAKYDSQGQFVWAKRMDGSALGLEVDSSGNLYVGGGFSNSANFGSYTLNSLGGSDQFAAKLDPIGNYLWATNWGTTDPELFSDMVLDQDSNLTIAGRSQPSGPSTTPGVTQLRQLNSQGQVVWTGNFSAPTRAVTTSLAFDASGDIYWAGSFKESVDLDPGSGVQWVTASATSNSSFIAKLSGNGVFQWAKTFDSDPSIDPNSRADSPNVAIGNDGFVTVLGSYQGNVGFSSNGGLSLPYSDTYKGYFAKLNPSNGGIATISAFGSSLGSIVGLIATTDGYAAVGWTGSTGFNPTPNISLAGKGSNDVWIMTLDGQGSITWAGLVGGTSIDTATDLTQDATGKLLVTGYSASTLFDFDPHPTRNFDVSRPASFVLKLKTQANTKFYVVDDAATNRTYEYDSTGAAVENYTIDSGNTTPRGAASNVSGNRVWVVDNNRRVYVYDTSGGLLGSWSAGTLGTNASIQGIATNGTDVWIVDSQSDKVYKYTGAATRLSGSQNAASFSLNGSFSLNSSNKDASDLVTHGTDIWVLNNTSSIDKVFKYSITGSLIGNWTISTPGVSSPTGITLNPAGPSELWIVDNGTDRVYQYDAAVGVTSGSLSAASSFALAAGNTNPQGIADPPPPSSSVRIPNAVMAPPTANALMAPLANPKASDIALIQLSGDIVHSHASKPFERDRANREPSWATPQSRNSVIAFSTQQSMQPATSENQASSLAKRLTGTTDDIFSQWNMDVLKDFDL